jgi:peptidoglycan/xylan/chitin deacetylase (PgdA/CDA1 family)
MKSIFALLVILTLNTFLFAQEKSVAITMDDLFGAYNNIDIEKIEDASDSLLTSITKHGVPVTVFVVEKSFSENGNTDKKLLEYNKWITNPLVTIGNHTYSHQNYSKTELSLFEEDILRGETITKELLKKTNKKLKYFRFPYNSTGKDSISRAEIYDYLNHRGYTITPFTIESIDYVYDALYCNFIKSGKTKEADRIIEKYINFTADLFQYFEDLTKELFGRNINHIFLCHTNRLNSACFEKLVTRLKDKGYNFITLDEALKDNIYQSKDYYAGQYGFSWIYRWIENSTERKILMKKEPYSKDILQQYENLK